MSTLPADIIDHLAGGDAGDLRRPVARGQAQTSFDALFTPVDDSAFSIAERWIVAAFATRLTADDAAAKYYADGARSVEAGRASAVIDEASRVATSGPYGAYSERGLAAENTDGPRYVADVDAFDRRLGAALEHTHLLTYRPRETDRRTHERLLEAGWSVDGIVTLSQLVAFLAFQQRVAAGLRVLAEEVSA